MLFATRFQAIIPTPKINETQTLADDVFLLYRPNINGARNAPASAPHEIPISCAINVTPLLYCTTAITAEIAINTTMKIRMINTCFFSVISFTIVPRIISSVSVEEDASTSDDHVDMDA